MSGTSVCNHCLIVEVVMNNLGKISSADFAHWAGMKVWDGTI